MLRSEHGCLLLLCPHAGRGAATTALLVVE
jgi:hypothetical protein